MAASSAGNEDKREVGVCAAEIADRLLYAFSPELFDPALIPVKDSR